MVRQVEGVALPGVVFGAGATVAGQVAHHVGVGIQFHLEFQMLITQRDQSDSVGRNLA